MSNTINRYTVISGPYDVYFIDKYTNTVLGAGNNLNGILGIGNATPTYTLTTVKDSNGIDNLTDIVDIFTEKSDIAYYLGFSNTIFIKNDGTAFYCGIDSSGSNKYTITNFTPNITDAKSAHIKLDEAFIIKQDGTVLVKHIYPFRVQSRYSIKINNYLADETGNFILNNVKKISSGLTHLQILKNDGTVWSALGSMPQFGYLGNGTFDLNPSNKIYQMKDTTGNVVTNVRDIYSYSNCSFILKNDGTVWACGYNGQSQLGNGNNINQNLLTQVKDETGNGFLTNVIQISGDSRYSDDISNYIGYTLFLKNDGTVFACGDNSTGQLGLGNTTNTNLVKQVKDESGNGYLQNILTISASNSRSFFVKNDSILGYGDNREGSLGVGYSSNDIESPPTSVTSNFLPIVILENNIYLNEGWNIIGTSYSADIIDFNSIISNTIYSMNKGVYSEPITNGHMESTKGYFIKAMVEGYIRLSNLTNFNNSYIDVSTGWNLIGVSQNSLILDPSNVIISNSLYTIDSNNSQIVTDNILQKNKGYYLKSLQNQRLYLQ